jgi:hypothetical protein
MHGGPVEGIVLDTDLPSETYLGINANKFDFKNLFASNASFDPVCILSNGNRHNLEIKDNKFYAPAPYIDLAAAGISLQGSEGTNNLIQNNYFDDVDGYLSCFNTGVNFVDFKNTTFCGNRFHNTTRSFYVSGQNDGTKITGNTTYGGRFLSIADQSWIEEQDNKGNQWNLEYLGNILASFISPQAECINPLFAQFSEFFVHTPQSTSIFGPGFNPYHPKDLSPDNDVEWWFEQGETPTSACSSNFAGAGNGDSKLKRSVANGSLAAQFNNPAMNWQAQRALYFALKQNPAMESLYPAYSTFRTARDGGNIGKMYQVSTTMNTARNGNSNLLNSAKNNLVAIENLLAQIKIADEGWQNAISTSEKVTAKAAKQQKLGELMELLHNAAIYESTHKQNLLNEIAVVKQTNNSIIPTNDWEGYEKTVNSAMIEYLQTETITEAQESSIKAIAELCPKYGGMAVYKARSIMPKCGAYVAPDYNEGCYPMPSPLMPIRSRSDDKIEESNILGLQLIPNPAHESLIVNVPKGKQGTLQVFNTVGYLVWEQPIGSEQNIIEVATLTQGIYYLNVLFSDGQRKCLKFVVSK